MGAELTIDFRLDLKTGQPDILWLLPNIVGNQGMIHYPANPQGRCQYYVDGKCQIHTIKPLECKLAHHSLKNSTIVRHGQEYRRSWRETDVLERYRESVQ